MSQPALNQDLLSSVAQHVHAGNRLTARLELEPQMSVVGGQASPWLWRAWLADSPGEARSDLQKARELDPNNQVVLAGIKFVEGLLDWQPDNIETDFDVDPELLVDPNDNESAVRMKSDVDVETDFDVDPEFVIDPADDAPVGGVEAGPTREAAAEVIVKEGSAPVDKPESQQSDAAQASSLTENEPNLLILAVDDSPTIRHLVSLTLTSAGYEVITAADGTEALQKMDSRRPALVLTDACMPKLDGYRLCRLIKNQDNTRDLPVVMLSDDDSVAEKLRRLVAGCTDHMVKPFESRDLIELVRAHAPISRGFDQGVEA